MKPSDDAREQLKHAVHRAAHLLPAQGPIGVFIHQNTLHAFQHLPFEEAVVAASEVYGTEPYMSEAAYREQIGRGRILPEDIDWVLAREPGDARLKRLLLVPGARPFQAETVQWHIDETDLLHRFRSDVDGLQGEPWPLFQACLRRVGVSAELPSAPRFERPRDRVLDATGVDLDDAIHPLLIRLCAVFLDQGIAYWSMPDRERGLLYAVRRLFSLPYALMPKYLGSLDEEFRRQGDDDAESVVLKMLDSLGIAPGDWDAFIQQELLALPGWAGLIYRLEKEPGLAPHEQMPCSMMEFLAVRLTMMAVAASHVADRQERSRIGPDVGNLLAAVRFFDVAQLLQLTASKLDTLTDAEVSELRAEIAEFSELERRRILHLAYERRHELLILLPLGQYSRTPRTRAEKRPLAQVFFCIDEREESMRRHLEEVEPEIETLSAAGFFGVAFQFTGIDDAHGAPLCPVVIKPQHAVRERSVPEDQHLLDLRLLRRKFYARFAFGTFVASRTLFRGWMATAALGAFSLVPLVTRVLSPLTYARWRGKLNRSFFPEPRTELQFILTDPDGAASAEGLQQGFSTQEKIDRVASVLGPAGLRSGFARLVVIFGHGSNSLNNPHESAHDCGACGGRRGGPNARLFAAMANHPQVREGLRERGIDIPEDTWFLGGYHDTCNDDVTLSDLEALPSTHREDLERVRIALDSARAWDAHERSRRFEAAADQLRPDQALHHVEERAQHLAEPRPEYGHCTNAVCIVGRRSTTRGLFLDRRAFLISYDATQDPEDSNLARLLGAAVPVCAGISLEYYFSFVDNEGYGCGTKLPHNVTGLVGVMNGHASDLRTGLPWQMVEVHEPVRILFVVETTPERVMRAFRTGAQLMELLEKRWVRLATHDPYTGAIHVYRDGVFEPYEIADQAIPSFATSADWYGGKMGHLPIAVIDKELVSR